MRNVLALDVDGVLNSLQYFENNHGKDFDHEPNMFDPIACELLLKLIEEANLEIVLSSAWRQLYTTKQIDSFISESLNREIRLPFVGFTRTFIPPKMSYHSKVTRGLEIQDWLDNNKDVTNFCIVDDSGDMGSLKPYLAQTTWNEGLQSKHIGRIKLILSSPYARPKWHNDDAKFLGEDLISRMK